MDPCGNGFESREQVQNSCVTFKQKVQNLRQSVESMEKVGILVLRFRINKEGQDPCPKVLIQGRGWDHCPKVLNQKEGWDPLS